VASDFTIASASAIEALRQLRPLASSSDSADVLLAALTYEGYEVQGEALALYERLCRLAPREAAFHAARAALYERAGRREDAERAWTEAKKLGFVRPAKK
jgi:Flp pilus assembly protein TadD